MTISRTTHWIASAILLTLGAAVAAAIMIPTLVIGGPTSTGQVNVAYNSALTATGGVPPYSFSISSGSLPSGLNLNGGTGAITGTPTTAGVFIFTGRVFDSSAPTDPLPSSGPDSQSAARRRVLAQSGNAAAPGVSASASYSITVAPAAPSGTPVPPSMWMAVTGLAGAGIFRLRQKRRG